MPVGNWNLQWLNHNAQRSYPLTEAATKQDTTRTITLPDSFIVALYIPVPANTTFTAEGFYISRLLLSATGFNIVIGYTDGQTTITDVAAANIARVNYVANRAYAVAGIDEFYDIVGYVVLGDLSDIDREPAGQYEFTYADGAIEADAIRPMLRAVSSLQISNNGEVSDRIYGHVTLVAGQNIKLVRSTVTVNGEIETRIRIDAISGENLNQECLCDVVETGPCITSINGVTTTDGNFVIAPNDCVSITTMANGLKFADTCAQPCCGCSELDALRNQVTRFGDGITTLQNFVTRLGSEVTQMSLVVLGSRLSTAQCPQE